MLLRITYFFLQNNILCFSDRIRESETKTCIDHKFQSQFPSEFHKEYIRCTFWFSERLPVVHSEMNSMMEIKGGVTAEITW